MEMTGAQILIEGLQREGVERVFGYAGATICPIADALLAAPKLAYTLVRTEQNAGHMASGYPSPASPRPIWIRFLWWPLQDRCRQFS